MAAVGDRWSEWLLHKRFGGDSATAERMLATLRPVRDRILDNAQIADGDVVLDAGCGDGLVGFGAAERVGERGRVIFLDVSEPLLERCREIARSLGIESRCEFVHASACDLSSIEKSSVDVVSTRSVLIYVQDKARAFAEFYRVLSPGGRISLWEPINRFAATFDGKRSPLGIEIPQVAPLVQRLEEHLRTLQPLDTDPMLNFDERDLLRHAEEAGFPEIHLQFDVRTFRAPGTNWDAWLASAPNPTIPTIGEMLRDVLSPGEFEEFASHVRPVLERGGAPTRMAYATVTATKAKEQNHA
jgi:ubiquinone/menaquinone biosynthesis C-methylase UbiE